HSNSIARQQAQNPEHEHPGGIDEGQGAGFLREGISAQALSLQVLVVELQRETGTQRLEQVTRRPVNQVALAAVDERYHAAMPSISPGGSRRRWAYRRDRSALPCRNRAL